jgi:hypothetical protein
MEEIQKRGYGIIKELAVGGEGKIYLCKKGEGLFALKVMLRLNDEQLETLKRIQRLGGEHFPALNEIFHDEHNTYLVREYVEGYTLAEELARNGGFTFARAKQIVRSLCDGLRLLHGAQPEPIIYRDLKPENIILTSGGGVRIIDFGIARRYKPDASRDTGPAGTAGYTAPEILSGFQSDTRSDVFSLGVILYEMLSGMRMRQPPYQIRPLKENAPYLPKGLDAVIQKATRPRPIDRYKNVDAFWDALESAGKRKTHRGWIVMCIALSAAVVAGGWFGLRDSADTETASHPDMDIESNAALQGDIPVEETKDPYIGRNIETVFAELAAQGFYPAVTGQTSAVQAGEILAWEKNDVAGMLITVSIGPTVDAVDFDDEALSCAVKEALGLPESGTVSSVDMALLTDLDANGRGIVSLSGLEYAVNLTALDLSGNKIVDPSPIGTLGRLETLLLDENDITDISVLARLRYVQSLSCDGNSITSVTALDGIDYHALSLAGNQIADISPLYRSVNLTALNIANNPVADLSVLTELQKLQTIDLSGVPAEDYTPLLYCAGLERVTLGEADPNSAAWAEMLAAEGISVSLSTMEANDQAVLPDQGEAALRMLRRGTLLCGRGASGLSLSAKKDVFQE